MSMVAVKRISAVLLYVSASISLVALFAFFVLLFLVIQSRMSTERFATIAIDAHTGGFIFFPVLMLVGGYLTLQCKRARISIRITSTQVWKAVWILWFAVLLHAFLTPARYVHFEGNKWISTGRTGSLVVSEQVARGYLVNTLEWAFLIVFGGSSVLALTSRGVVEQIGSSKGG